MENTLDSCHKKILIKFEKEKNIRIKLKKKINIYIKKLNDIENKKSLQNLSHE